MPWWYLRKYSPYSYFMQSIIVIIRAFISTAIYFPIVKKQCSYFSLICRYLYQPMRPPNCLWPITHGPWEDLLDGSGTLIMSWVGSDLSKKSFELSLGFGFSRHGCGPKLIICSVCRPDYDTLVLGFPTIGPYAIPATLPPILLLILPAVLPPLICRLLLIEL